MKQIIVANEIRERLMQLFKVNRTTIWRALNYRGESALYPKIRTAAIEMGGEVVGGEKLDTTFDIGVMVQTYGGRLRIVSDMRDGQIVVYIDGIVQECVSGLSIAEYVRLQQRYIRKVDVQ
ncbi:hypothetical protein IX308_000423 [Porphyromonas levii]|uniref:hypothetical protein n=1 Tax=Porphyromonas levii TaxID=28114 RepID=UPI001BADAB59|nr:hypothetical protein [Porphyromonas levii]MBR8784254.1 hypothetical protein [Porphyromonas levii]